MPKARIYAIVAAIVVIVAAGMVWYNQKDKPVEEARPTGDEQMQSSTPPASDEPASAASSTSQTETSIMEGLLKKSDNAKKGNYMLVLEDRTVYIFTSRDFSSLVGKTVAVTYEGTLEDFILGDITTKQ